MQNKFVSVVVKVLALLVLAFYIIKFSQDVVFFLTKKEADANILDMEDLGTQEAYLVTLKYYDEYLSKDFVCKIEIKKSYVNQIKQGHISVVRIHYGDVFPENLYLIDFQTPTFAILLIDLIIMWIMWIILTPFFKALRRFCCIRYPPLPLGCKRK